jgi:hypothetical protein
MLVSEKSPKTIVNLWREITVRKLLEMIPILQGEDEKGVQRGAGISSCVFAEEGSSRLTLNERVPGYQDRYAADSGGPAGRRVTTE